MKIVIFICCFIGAICACGNAKSNPQDTAKVADINIEVKEVVEEQGTVFYDITPEEAFKKAEAEGKYVLICFSTETCGPCKKMKKVVFPTAKCGEYVNTRFVTIAMDGEDGGVGQELAKKYDVFIFPTYLVLQPDGFREGMIQGAEFDVNKFLEMLKTIIHDV